MCSCHHTTMKQSPELLVARQAVASDIDTLIHSRVSTAAPIETLSDRGDKLLEVVQEANGQKFVTRRFSRDAISRIEMGGLSFTEAWQAMHKKFGDAGIKIVPSHLLATEEPYPFTVVSKYLENGQPLIEAPTQTKIELANNLGKTLRGRYMLQPAMLNPDMFMVDNSEDGSLEAYIVDLDPLIIPRPIVANVELYPWRAKNLEALDGIDAYYIDQLSGLFYNHWCTEEEKRAVLSTLYNSLVENPSLTRDSESKTWAALMALILKAASANTEFR